MIIFVRILKLYTMSKSRITIKDLARELNISTSTVSRALADKWDVNPETRKAVLELAEKMNYHPNPISLSLKQNQTMSIGVIVPEFINSFFAEVIMASSYPSPKIPELRNTLKHYARRIYRLYFLIG